MLAGLLARVLPLMAAAIASLLFVLDDAPTGERIAMANVEVEVVPGVGESVQLAPPAFPR